jgi:predicted nucleic acid-binding protein
MSSILVDTSFLISLSDMGRENHGRATRFFDFCLADGHTLWLSSIVSGEFAVGQPLDEIPLRNFVEMPYTLAHSLVAAEFFRELKGLPREGRAIIANDVKLLAQAQVESVSFLLSEDEGLRRRAARLPGFRPKVILLRDAPSPAAIF